MSGSNESGLSFEDAGRPVDMARTADGIVAEHSTAPFPGSDDIDDGSGAQRRATTKPTPLRADADDNEGEPRSKKPASPLFKFLPYIVMGGLAAGLIGFAVVNMSGDGGTPVQISAPQQAGNPFSQAPQPQRQIPQPMPSGYAAPAGVQAPAPAYRSVNDPSIATSPPAVMQATTSAPAMPVAGAPAVPAGPPLLPRPAPQPLMTTVDDGALANLETRIKSAIAEISTTVVQRLDATDRSFTQYQARLATIETRLAAAEKLASERPAPRIDRPRASEAESSNNRSASRATNNDEPLSPPRAQRRSETPEPRATAPDTRAVTLSHSEPTTLVYTLRGANAQEALISPPNAAISDVIRVRAGDSVPGLGKITEIRQIGQEWVVATERGLITRR